MAKALELVLYAEDGWTGTKIETVCKNYNSIAKFAYILHDQDLDENRSPVKEHFHVYLNFGNSNVTEKECANWFSAKEHQVQRIKARGRNAIFKVLRYYIHRNTPEKHQYAITDIHGTIDAAVILQNGEASDRESEILNSCASGEITPTNFTEYISVQEYADLESKLQRAWGYHERATILKQGANRTLCTIFISGPSGSGKTTLARLFAEAKGLSVYVTAEGSNPMDRYLNEEAVIWDDFRPSKNYSYEAMLKIMDPHTASPLHCRYRDRMPNFSHLIFTSSLTVQEIIELFDLPPMESPLQFYRRISQYWQIDGDYIFIAEFDLEKGLFIPKQKMRNFIPDYIASLEKPQGANLTVSETAKVLEEISHQYQQPKQLSLFDQEC